MNQFTQASLAKVADVSESTIFRVEKAYSIRYGSLKKICDVLHVTPELVSREKFKEHVKQQEQSILFHPAENSEWFANFDRRKHIPEDNQSLIQNFEERLRLGRQKLVPLFVTGPSFVMPEGPGTCLIEVYERIEGINESVYKDAIVYCLKGAVKITMNDESTILNEGSFFGYDNRLDIVIEPYPELDNKGYPACILWTGANLLAKPHSKG